MNARNRLVAWLLGALLAGALGFLLLGTHPGEAGDGTGQGLEWTLPEPLVRELEAADAVWSMRTPWGAASSPEAGAAEAAAPVPVLVGVVAEGGEFRAVFVLQGTGEVQARVGDVLPDASKVTAVSRFRVEWTDAQGNQHEQELLANPLPPASRGSH